MITNCTEILTALIYSCHFLQSKHHRRL